VNARIFAFLQKEKYPNVQFLTTFSHTPFHPSVVYSIESSNYIPCIVVVVAAAVIVAVIVLDTTLLISSEADRCLRLFGRDPCYTRQNALYSIDPIQTREWAHRIT